MNEANDSLSDICGERERGLSSYRPGFFLYTVQLSRVPGLLCREACVSWDIPTAINETSPLGKVCSFPQRVGLYFSNSL